MTIKIFAVCLAVFLFISSIKAQKAEVVISLNEQFFDALLETVFQNFPPPEFSIAAMQRPENKTGPTPAAAYSFASHNPSEINTQCSQTIKILRELNSVRTAVRFREGKVYVPMAFSGTYSVPFVGCVDFAGVAETNIDLIFDQGAQKLIGRANVFAVNLSGSGGVGSSAIARMLQSSIDKKLNPIEILSLEQISFGVPIPRTGTVRMRAIGMRPEINNQLLNLRIDYQFLKG